MARGPKKHLKRLAAPKHWMLTKMGGTWAPRPSTGPHKMRECLPLILILRNRLKYALTKKEVQQILMQRLIKVDGKVRTDSNYPCGFMDVISIDKSDEHFRMMYDAKGRFVLHRLNSKTLSNENSYKLARVQSVAVGAKGVPYIVTHDGRTIRYPDPLAKLNDVVKVDIETGKAKDVIKFESGATCVVTKGQNQGRIGVITAREKHIGSFEIVHVKDSKGRAFATRIANVFVLSAKDDEGLVSLPRGKGLRDNILEERKKRLGY
jgi:small subunit ribosomal protein S4e